jgi:hypothetical protein
MGGKRMESSKMERVIDLTLADVKARNRLKLPNMYSKQDTFRPSGGRGPAKGIRCVLTLRTILRRALLFARRWWVEIGVVLGGLYLSLRILEVF